jgi:hypothetical protein
MENKDLKFKNVRVPPWQLSKELTNNIYTIQKKIPGNRYYNIRFMLKDVPSLARVLCKLPLFRTEVRKALAESRKDKKKEEN